MLEEDRDGVQMTDKELANTKGWYVPQLDGLRFWAFLLVFVHHLPSSAQALKQFPMLSTWTIFLNVFGWIGVDLFLVLSAFLITTLLLQEQKREGKISLKDFYVRRSLRIWPLYYFMLLLGFVVFPFFGFFQADIGSVGYQKMVSSHLIPNLTFLGNFSAGFFGYVPSQALSHMWTISLEEQFYILWPALLVLVGPFDRKLTIVLVGLLLFTILMRFYFVGSPINHPMVWTNLITRLDPFVLGSALAIYRSRVSCTGKYGLLKAVTGILLIYAMTRFPNITSQSMHVTWQYLSVAIGFTFLIDSALGSQGRIAFVFLMNKPIVRLGKLGYGLYVFHLIGIKLAEVAIKSAGIVSSPFWSWLTLATLALTITIVLAWASYQLIELPFLRLKERYTHIKSRSIKL